MNSQGPCKAHIIPQISCQRYKNLTLRNVSQTETNVIMGEDVRMNDECGGGGGGERTASGDRGEGGNIIRGQIEGEEGDEDDF